MAITELLKNENTNQEELFKLKNAMESALVELEKVDFILEHLRDTYFYSEQPDPRAAIACLNATREDGHSKNSAQWFYEYNKIINFIEVVYDYVLSTEKILEQVYITK